TDGSVTVSGTLAQGIYGDDLASVWVFYGRQDGGTSRAAWEKSQFIGLNTNFIPHTFTTTLTNLAPGTNYFFRFNATNSHGEAWAPASSTFSTLVLNPPDISVSSGSGSLFLTWPLSGVSFGLYTASNLIPPVAWNLVTNPPLLTNGQWQISLPIQSGPTSFFRL